MSDLTFDQIIFKASHNSYDKNGESLASQLTFNPAQPYNNGCMAIELDIWRESSPYTPYVSIAKDYFKVGHTSPGDDLCDYFADVLNWHKSNPGHDVVLITLDIKSWQGGYDNFQDEIDTYLKCYFGEELIFKPNKLMLNSSLSLCANVVSTGWPKLSSPDLKGKFIFCLSGNADWKAEYARTNLNQRYCFSDLDESDSNAAVQPPTSGNIVFFNFHIYNSSRDVWMTTIPPFSTNKLITRAYVIDSETNWTNCMNANVSAIATDSVTGSDWCKVSNTAEYKQKTQFYDKRYLKNKANNEYRTNEATKMQDTFESPDCTFIFHPFQNGTEIVYALQNAANGEYLDCSISSMSGSVDGNCQKWRLKVVSADRSEYYVQNLENGEYLTKKASQLSDSAGTDEVYIINEVD